MQTRREFLKSISFSVAALSLTGCKTGSAQVNVNKAVNKPNIIFIMTDDMGYGDTTVYNPDSKIPTPNMERLAKQGIVFTDAHSPSAVCTPTRYGLLTGRYCWRSPLKRGVYGGYNKPLIEEERMTVASLLKKHGYTTAGIGKWHLGMDWTLKEDATRQRERTIDFTKPLKSGPNELGFDYFFGTPGCPTDDPPFCFVENNKTVGVPDMISPDDPAYEDIVKGLKVELLELKDQLGDKDEKYPELMEVRKKYW